MSEADGSHRNASDAETGTAEISNLRRSIRDLVALSMLPALWTGRNQAQIAGSLAEALLSTIRSSLVYVRLTGLPGADVIEAARADGRPEVADRAQEIGTTLIPWIPSGLSSPAVSAPDPVGGGTFRLIASPIGAAGKWGTVVVCARRSDFPTDQERLLLNVGANQAAIALQEVSIQATLRLNQRELNDFFDNALVGLQWLGPDRTVLRVNQAQLDLLGYDRDEYVGHLIAEFHADPNTVNDIFRRLLAGETLHDYAAQMRCKDGTIKQVLIDSNVLWEQDRFVHTRCFFRDITEQKRAEDALKASEERYRLLFEACPVGYILLNREGRVEAWNPAAEQIFGWTAAEAIAQPSLKFIVSESFWPLVEQLLSEELNWQPLADRSQENVPWVGLSLGWPTLPVHYEEGDDKPVRDQDRLLEQLVSRLLQVQQPVTSINENVTKDGRIIICDWHNIPIMDADGTPTHFLSIVQDITERKEAETALQMSESRYRQLSEELERRVNERTEELTHMVQALNAEVSEREQAERTSRAQAQTLIHTTEHLTQNDPLEDVRGIVLAAIGEQLEAFALALWLADSDAGVMRLDIVCQDGRVIPGAASGSPYQTITREEMQRDPHWKRLMQERQVAVYDMETVISVAPTTREYIAEHNVKQVIAVPLALGDEVVGLLSIRFTDAAPVPPEKIALAQALAHQATLAIRLSRLTEQARQAAVLEERNRMAREIHDTLAQAFTGILMQLGAAERLLASDPVRSQSHFQSIGDLAREGLAEARRSVQALRPQALEQMDLAGALAQMVQKLNYGQTPRLEFHLHGVPRGLRTDVADHLLRMGQEALTNALRHSGANMIRVELTFADAEIRLCVQDNGRGFDVNSPEHKEGFGLRGIRERAGIVGAELTVISMPMIGTRIDVKWRMPSV
jgi:PAS domain S-box-containing protein